MAQTFELRDVTNPDAPRWRVGWSWNGQSLEVAATQYQIGGHTDVVHIEQVRTADAASETLVGMLQTVAKTAVTGSPAGFDEPTGDPI